MFHKKRDRDLDDELNAHLAMAERERLERGESPESAARNARREFGNEALIREATRDVWGWASLERIAKDVRYGFRTLRRNPGFTLTALLCLSLGIAATTTTFSIADSLLLRPLPVHDADRVVVVTTTTTDDRSAGLSYRDLVHIDRYAGTLDGVVGFQLASLAFAKSADDITRMKMGMYVAGDFFPVLGVQPLHGRGFSRDETSKPGEGAAMVLSYPFWQSEFGAREDAIGSTVRLNGVPFTIIGVAPEHFTVHQNLSPAYYLPLTMTNRLAANREKDPLEARDIRGINVRAHLRTGVSLEQAQGEIAAIGNSLASTFPDTHRRHTLTLRTEIGERIAQAPPLAVISAVLVALSALVLIIACANVASLLLARARSRAREISIRLSIGAGRSRLLQQLLTETMVLSAFAGAVGVLLSYMAIRYLAAIPIPTDTPIVLAVRLDSRVLFSAIGAAFVTVVAAGLVPAWRSLGELRTAAGGRMLGRHALVATQVALSVVLLVVSGTLVDAFGRMLLINPGIRTDHIMMVELDPGLVQYTPERAEQFYRTLTDRVRTLPGVRSVSLSRALPFRPNFSEQEIVPEGFSFPRNETFVKVSSNVVDEGYFDTTGTAVIRGRAFSRADTKSSGKVTIVNEELARRYWPGQDAIGKRLRLGQAGDWLQVIGLVQTGKYLSLVESPQPYFYLPFAQHPRTRMTLLTHTDGDAAGLARPIVDTIRSIDPNQPVYNVRDMRTFFQQGVLGKELTIMQIVWAMGAIGLLLASIGLYGLISFSVARRTREIGIRMAIGADRSQVLRMVLRQGVTIAGIGIGAGTLLSIPAFRALSSGLSGLGGLSMWTLALVPAGLVVVAAAATWMPARHASQINPNIALRMD